jgi:hypothetical protein
MPCGRRSAPRFHSPQFLLPHQIDYRNRVAGCLLAVIADEGEPPVSRHGDFMRPFTHAHARDDFSRRRIYDGQRTIRLVQDQ